MDEVAGKVGKGQVGICDCQECKRRRERDLEDWSTIDFKMDESWRKMSDAPEIFWYIWLDAEVSEGWGQGIDVLIKFSTHE